MSSQIAVVAMFAGLSAAVFGLVTFPRRFVQPMLRARVWRLLDEIDRSIRAGRLPGDHPSIRELRRRICTIARSADRIRLTHLYFIHRNLPAFEIRDEPTMHGLSTEQQRLAGTYRIRLTLLGPLVVATGTWPGLLATTAMLAKALVWYYGDNKRRPKVDGDKFRTSYVAAEQIGSVRGTVRGRRHNDLVGV